MTLLDIIVVLVVLALGATAFIVGIRNLPPVGAPASRRGGAAYAAASSGATIVISIIVISALYFAENGFTFLS